MSHNQKSATTLILAIICSFTCQWASAAEFADLAKHVPNAANALVLVDAEEIFKSPIAQQEGWQANREKQFSAGLTSVPPKAAKLLLSANIDTHLMEATWEAAVVEAESRTLMSTLARKFGGSLDKIYQTPAVRLPDNSFVLEFSEGTFGMIRPGNRQQVSRWVNDSIHNLSEYLQQGIHYADTNAQVIMLLDLQDAFSPSDLDLERLESVQNSKVDRDKLNKLIASVQGVMLGVTFRDKINGSLKIDFDQKATLISDIAKPLILDILGAYGLTIDELSDWNANVKGSTVYLTGELSQNGMTRLSSLTRLPTPVLQHTDALAAAEAPAATDTPATDAPTQQQKPTVLEATRKYYQSVTHLLDNLKDKKGDWKTMGQLAQWFENYGRHVDQLPTLGVDKEMLAYGAYISSQLHGASMGLKGTTIQKRVDEIDATNQTRIYGGALGNISQENWQQNSYGYYGGTYGGNYGRIRETNAAYGIARSGGYAGAVNSELRQQQRAQTTVRANAKASAATGVQQIVQNIQTATTQVRQSMTDKYQVQF